MRQLLFLLCAFFGLVLFTAVVSCTKTIHIDLKDATPQIVIEANISDYAAMKVQITKTTGFYNVNTFPAVSDAVVVVSDKASGLKDTLREADSGIYRGKYKGKPGRTYQLYVKAEGQEYTAESTMPYAVPLDSVSFSRHHVFGTNTIDPTLYFQDPKDTANYYRFTVNILRSQRINSYNFEDRLSDGKYISYALRSDSEYIQPKDTLVFRMQCVSKAAYQYFYALEDVAAATDDEVIAVNTPANPPTNISNNALGIFNLYTDYWTTVVVPDIVY